MTWLVQLRDGGVLRMAEATCAQLTAWANGVDAEEEET